MRWPWSCSRTPYPLPSCYPMKDGWRVTGRPNSGLSFSDMVADLKSWGFEVCREGGE